MIDLAPAIQGVTITDNGTLHFRTWAPHAKAVALTGSFNKWSKKGIPLEAEENGNWFLATDQAQVGDEYQFIITTQNGDQLFRNDPYCRQLTNSDGNAIIYNDDAFDWNEDNYVLPAWNELVIYEMHIGTFNVVEEGKPGTFATAIKRLDYLEELGINVVEVMPINEFAGDYSWGYNPAYPYAVEEAYGGPDALKEFVKACHQRGIGVILDVVYNHFGPSDLGLWQYDGWSENDKGGIYFYNDWRSDTPWGDTRPDYGRNEVRSYIHDNAMLWLDKYHCDGLRMDMIPYMRSVNGSESPGDDIPEGYSLLKWINDSVNERFPGKITIAEDLHGNNFVTDSTSDGGCGFGAQWDADFVHPIRKVLIEAEDANRNMEAISTAMLRRYGDDAFSRVIYTESHDEVANGQARVAEEIAGNNENVNNYYSIKRSALGVLLTLTTPGIPMLFQGQALLEDKWFSDQDPLDWSKLNRFCGVNNLHRDMIKLRRNQPGLQGQHTMILHAHPENKVLAFMRWNEDPLTDGVLVIMNFSNQTFENYEFGANYEQNWKLCLNSDWAGYSDENNDTPVAGLLETSSEAYNDHPFRIKVNIAAYGGYVFCHSC